MTYLNKRVLFLGLMMVAILGHTAEDAPLVARARPPEKVLQDFKSQDSNLPGQMALVSEYCAVISQLEKTPTPSDAQKKLLAQYKNPENLKEIVFQSKQILDTYRDQDDKRQETRKADLKRLSDQAEFLQQKLLETQVKTKPPTAEETQAIEKFLKEFSSHLDAKHYEKLAHEYIELAPGALPENRKDHEEESVTLLKDVYGASLKKLLTSLLDHRDNWFIFTDSKSVKTALLVRVKADAQALGKDYVVFQIKWYPEGMRSREGFGFFGVKEAGPLNLK